MNSLIGKRIGVGGNSEVFEWEKDKALKLFYSDMDEYGVNKEFNNIKLAWKNGLPTYMPYEQIVISGRLGIIYEKIEGQTFMELLLKEYDSGISINLPLSDEDKSLIDTKDNLIRLTAKILYDIHKKVIPEFPDQTETLKWHIFSAPYLTEHEKEKINNIVDNLPKKSFLCHGDPNPGNFIMREGKPLIIDWMNASSGNPAADIAEYIVMMRYAVLPEGLPESFAHYFNNIREFLIEIFLDEYIKLSGMKYEEIDAWLLPIMCVKLKASAICKKEKDILLNCIREKLK